MYDRALERQTYHWQRKQHRDKVGDGAGDQDTEIQHSSRTALFGLDRRAHMVARREEAVVSADGHECSEETNGPHSHEDDPRDDYRAEFRNVEDLQIEE